MASRIQFKRGLKANLPYLNSGEPAFCTDTQQLFIGLGGSQGYAVEARLDKGEVYSNPNLLINGSFQVWQTGTSFNLSSAGYCADMWKAQYASVTKQSGYIQFVPSSSSFNVFTYIENKKLSGDITVSAYVKGTAGIGFKFRVSVDGATILQPSSFTLTGDWQFVEYTFNIPARTASPTNIIVYLYYPQTSSYPSLFQMQYAKAEVGKKATAYTYPPAYKELEDCQRYYWVSGYAPTGSHCAYVFNNTGGIMTNVRFPKKMYRVPGITFVGNGSNGYIRSTADASLVVASNAFIYQLTEDGFPFVGLSTAPPLGSIYDYNILADARIS